MMQSRALKLLMQNGSPISTNIRKLHLKLPKRFGAIFVRFQKVYDEAAKRAPAPYWTSDGVHAALPGAQLMAGAWNDVSGLKD